MGQGYEGAATHWDDNVIPADRTSEQDILNWLNENHADETVPPGLKNELADRISDRREAAEVDGERTFTRPDSDEYYDPDSKTFREPESGNFASDPRDENGE